MAAEAVTTRRAALVGAFASSLTLALAVAPAIDGTAHAAAPAETPTAKVQRLGEELAVAMAAAAKVDPLARRFRAVVDCDRGFWLEARAQARKAYELRNFIEGDDHPALIDYHSLQLGKSLVKQHGHRWVGSYIRGSEYEVAYDAMLFVQRPGAPSFSLDHA